MAKKLLGFSFAPPVQIHTYLWFKQTVQIDIWKFSPTGNVFTQGNPPAEANEPPVPNGYEAAIANPPVLNILSGQGANIRPLGSSRENGITVARKKFEFIDDIGNLTELNLPVGNNSFPLVNIGYVIINKPKNERG